MDKGYMSMDFIIALPRIQRGHDAIMVVVDPFIKMAHLVSCNISGDGSYIAPYVSKRSSNFMKFQRA